VHIQVWVLCDLERGTGYDTDGRARKIQVQLAVTKPGYLWHTINCTRKVNQVPEVIQWREKTGGRMGDLPENG